MTIPTRPAPPPPRSQQVSSNHVSGLTQLNAPSASTGQLLHKKPAPPRPPPPKTQSAAPLKKTGSQKSISILSNLFGASKSNIKSSDKMSHTSSEQRIPPKIPSPPANHLMRSHQRTQQTVSDVQLINFEESLTPSPPAIKKSNTGSDSMDSFCSSNSSPNNLGCSSGTTSQAESGFEDDFSVSDFKVTSGSTTRSTTFSNDPFDCLDDFEAPVKANNLPPSNIRNVKPLIQPKPSIGSSSFYTCTSSIMPSPSVPTSFDDSLSNGKNLIKPSSVSMPTIIKPVSSKGKTSTNEPAMVHFDTKKTAPVLSHQLSDESFDDSLPSLPMPSMPPPPLPDLEDLDGDDEEKESYAIVLYDFDSDVVEDLNLKTNEKVYLLKQMNDEWMLGRNKRGCEGIFPISYVDVRVPLKQVEPDSGTASRSASVSPATEGHRIRSLYNFNAETDEDLSIKENEVVNVMYEVNPEWLYGSNELGDYGQFPANFIEYVPQNLPLMPK